MVQSKANSLLRAAQAAPIRPGHAEHMLPCSLEPSLSKRNVQGTGLGLCLPGNELSVIPTLHRQRKGKK